MSGLSGRPDVEAWRHDLTLQAEPGRYLRPLAVGAVAELVVGIAAAVLVGLVGFGLVSGYPEGAVPAGRVVAVGALGVLSVAVAVLAGGLMTARSLRSATLPPAHARAIGTTWSVGLAVLLLVLGAALGSGGVWQLLEGLLGVVLGAVLVLARSPAHGRS